MTAKRSLLAAVVLAVSPLAASAATIIDYDLTGLTTTAPASVAPTTVATGISGNDLTRGPGVGASGLTNGFSANDWNTTTASQANAIADDEYFQFGFDVDPLYVTSLDTLDFSLRRSATDGPMNYEVQASLDGFTTAGVSVATFQYLGRNSGTAPAAVTPYQWMTTDTPGQSSGNPISTIDLSGTSILQNVTGPATVTFRLFAWGEGNGASTNTVALGRIDGPTIGGSIVQIPEPSSIALCGAALAAGCIVLRRK